MTSETIPSEQTILDERIAGFCNDVIDCLISKPYIVAIVLIVFVFIILLFRNKLKIISVFPPHIDWVSSPTSASNSRIDRLITDAPAPAPKEKKAKLPNTLRTPDRRIKDGNRQRIVIKCSDRNAAEEYGRLWFHKLFEINSPTYDHIGWIDYEKKRNQKEFPDLTLAACFYAELSYLRAEYKDPSTRYSKQVELFMNSEKHTILFINILEFPDWIVRDLGRHNNFPGLSIILISDREIDGYEVYELSGDGGDR